VSAERAPTSSKVELRQFKPYPAYKESDVEWLGKVPANWSVKRTKFAARLRSGHTPSRQHAEYWLDCTVPWFGLADVWQIRDGRTEYVSVTNEKISEFGLANSSARLLPKGTVMLSRTASVGFSAIMGVDMATTQDFANWVCVSNLRPEYLLYVLRSMQHEFHRLTMGSTHQTIYMPDIGKFSTPIPTISEQDRIVDFIRWHTRRIDALIVKKEQLIELLQEKRTAHITRAVTRGLDPNIPLKDSGVPWLGAIPAHWEVRPVFTVAESFVGFPFPSDGFSLDAGTRLVRGDNVTTEALRWGDKTRYWPGPAPDARYFLESGDIVLGMDGSKVGRNYAIVSADDLPLLLVQRVTRLRARPIIEPAFLFQSIAGPRFHGHVDYHKTDPAIPHITLKDIELFPVAVPPLNEQKAIIAHINLIGGRLTTLATYVQEAVNRLRELRTALISAAVTGKIDVREEAA
jgi:type I restriction enzyme, S subunit